MKKEIPFYGRNRTLNIFTACFSTDICRLFQYSEVICEFLGTLGLRTGSYI